MPHDHDGARSRREAALQEVIKLLKSKGYEDARRKDLFPSIMYGDFQVATFHMSGPSRFRSGPERIKVQGASGMSETRTYPWSEKKQGFNCKKIAETIGEWIDSYQRQVEYNAQVKADTEPNEEAVGVIHALTLSGGRRFRADIPFDASAKRDGVEIRSLAQQGDTLIAFRALDEILGDGDTVHIEGDIPASAIRAIRTILRSGDYYKTSGGLGYRTTLTADQAVEFARRIYGKDKP